MLLPLLAAGVAALAWIVHALTASPAAWVLLWPAAVLAAAWLVYLAGAPRAFGKRPDGRMSPLGWLAWSWIFVYQRISHEWVRRWGGEPVGTEVAPGIWVGRRPRSGELPGGIAIVVDLCCEFAEPRAIREVAAYLAVPTLDARSPRPAEIARIVDRVVTAGGPAFIHCALGHGRSATVAAAVLVRRGDATLADVEAKMKALRPKIGLNDGQRAALAEAVRLGAGR